MSRQIWANSEIVQLRKLAKTHTTQEAAAALGRTRASVENRARKFGISFRKHGDYHHSTTIPTAVCLEIVTLREQGVCMREIAQRIGASPNHVRMIARGEKRWRDTLPHLLAEGEAAKP